MSVAGPARTQIDIARRWREGEAGKDEALRQYTTAEDATGVGYLLLQDANQLHDRIFYDHSQLYMVVANFKSLPEIQALVAHPDYKIASRRQTFK